MSLILNIDTATETAYINIAENGVSLGEARNEEMKDHAGFLQTAIQALAKKIGINLHELEAIAVTAGPGSYTGLRVGMASAKGLCYALNKPLITMGTLEVMTDRAILQSDHISKHPKALFCPMIDARRMEVFTAIYTGNFDIIQSPEALILTDHSYEKLLSENIVYFFGNGSKKWQNICISSNVIFLSLNTDALYMSRVSYKEFCSKKFADLAYCEPMYLKEFDSTQRGN